MSRVSHKSVARYGARIGFSVTNEVAAALIEESKRLKRTVEHVASEVLHQWYELDWLPTQEEQTKKKPAS